VRVSSLRKLDKEEIFMLAKFSYCYDLHEIFPTSKKELKHVIRHWFTFHRVVNAPKWWVFR